MSGHETWDPDDPFPSVEREPEPERGPFYIPIRLWEMGERYLEVFLALQIGWIAVDESDPQYQSSHGGPLTPWTWFSEDGLAMVARARQDVTSSALDQLEANGFIDLCNCRGSVRLRGPGSEQGSVYINSDGAEEGLDEFGYWSEQIRLHLDAQRAKAERYAPPPRGRPGFVYVMTANPERGPYKVGRSVDPGNRRKQIQNTNTDEVQILRVWNTDDMSADERSMHIELSLSRTHGEFFACSLKDIDAAAEKVGLTLGATTE